MTIKKDVESKLEDCKYYCMHNKSNYQGNSCAIYGIGIFGAAVYFFPQATDFLGYALALVKSIGWPAVLVYQALSLLKV
jgi:hypothetical protein